MEDTGREKERQKRRGQTIEMIFESRGIKLNMVKGLRLDYFYLSHTQLYREYITSSEMYSLHLTHPKWTHTRSSGQPCLQRPGSSWGFGALLKDTSVVVLKEDTPPTIPAGPEIRTHNLPLTSPTRLSLGHDCPLYRYVYIYTICKHIWMYYIYACSRKEQWA